MYLHICIYTYRYISKYNGWRIEALILLIYPVGRFDGGVKRW